MPGFLLGPNRPGLADAAVLAVQTVESRFAAHLGQGLARAAFSAWRPRSRPT